MQDAKRDAAVTEALSRVPLFAHLPPEQISWVAAHGEEIRLEAGSVIAREGDPPDGFYVVLEGETEWTRRVGGQDVFVIALGEGSIFAELIMVLDVPYPTTGRAGTDVRLLRLNTGDFWEMLKVCPQVLRGILVTSVERAELHESVSQQHAKLISLGTMAAGLAHELNNPAAAVGRSAGEARETFREASARAVELGALGMSPEERRVVAGLPAEVARKAEAAPTLDSLDTSDREDEVALWLEDRGVEEAWDLAPTLAAACLDAETLAGFAGEVGGGTLSDALGWLGATLELVSLAGEVETSAGRISDLVGAIKEHTYMDRAAYAETDVREGLEGTLTILGHRLRGVEVGRDYDPHLPKIWAHAGELNQVWTNLIDNAADAVSGETGGGVVVRAYGDGDDGVVVEVADDGPGIPREVQGRVFEPFFTTKAIGEGTGLGLDVARRVVRGHGGEISFDSDLNNGTRFVVRLPVNQQRRVKER